jgi:HEPN domain-containing protein
MSDEKNAGEARRWFLTARGDLESARVLRSGGRWAHSCFHAQQAAEKALKALWYRLDRDPWGYSVRRLLDELAAESPEAHNALRDLSDAASELDQYYIPTRYPNGLPDLTPDQVFTAAMADHAEELATRIIDRISRLME